MCMRVILPVRLFYIYIALATPLNVYAIATVVSKKILIFYAKSSGEMTNVFSYVENEKCSFVSDETFLTFYLD